VVYRLGLAASRREARQLVTHRHFIVNGRTVNVPSASLRPGDTVQVREKSREIVPILAARKLAESRAIPDWLEFNAVTNTGTLKRLPDRHEMEQAVDEQLIVEYYSR